METEAHHRNISCVLNYAPDINENVYQKRDTKNIVDEYNIGVIYSFIPKQVYTDSLRNLVLHGQNASV